MGLQIPLVNTGGSYCVGPTSTPPPPVCTFAEGFASIATLPPSGWVQANNSSPIGTLSWFQGDTSVFPAQGGDPNSYIAVNYNSGSGSATISNWLLTPAITLRNNAVLSFWTRTVDTPMYPDRLQIRMSTNGSSSNVGSSATDVGDFTTLLLDINPTYTTTGYPTTWTNFTVTLSNIAAPVEGRLPSITWSRTAARTASIRITSASTQSSMVVTDHLLRQHPGRHRRWARLHRQRRRNAYRYVHAYASTNS